MDWLFWCTTNCLFQYADQNAEEELYSKKHSDRRQVYRPKSDGKVGLGGYIFNDKNGLVQRTGFQFSYAYHMWLRKETQLSMGLALTGYHYKINEKEINFEDPNEPWLNNDLRQRDFCS